MVDSQSFGRPSFGTLFVGTYCLLAVAMFGVALLDRAYADAVGAAFAAADVDRVFRPVADALLQLLAATGLAGLVAIAGAWSSTTARKLLLASTVVLIAQPFAPAALPFLASSAWGFWLRLAMSGATAVLALAGLRQLRHRS